MDDLPDSMQSALEELPPECTTQDSSGCAAGCCAGYNNPDKARCLFDCAALLLRCVARENTENVEALTRM